MTEADKDKNGLLSVKEYLGKARMRINACLVDLLVAPYNRFSQSGPFSRCL